MAKVNCNADQSDHQEIDYRSAAFDAVSVCKKLSFLTGVLNRAEHIDEIQGGDSLETLSIFLSEITDQMFLVVDYFKEEAERQNASENVLRMLNS